MRNADRWVRPLEIPNVSAATTMDRSQTSGDFIVDFKRVPAMEANSVEWRSNLIEESIPVLPDRIEHGAQSIPPMTRRF